MARIRPTQHLGGVVGFDLSLKAPAACFIPAGWELGDWNRLTSTTYVGHDDALVRTTADGLRWQYRRLAKISEWARAFVLTHRAAHTFVENYAFSKSSSSVTRLAELGGVARVELLTYGRTLIPIVASSARKLILGKVPREDQKVVTQQALWDHGAEFANGDECDAFVVANAGLSEIGLPFLSLA